MPTKVAADGKIHLDGKFLSKVKEIYPVDMTEEAAKYSPEKLWNVTQQELALAKDLDLNCPETGSELIDRVHHAGCGDMFPYLSEKDLGFIASDGKIPKHERWAQRIESGELAIDTLLNLAGLASFTADQAELDDRIRRIISA